MDAYDESELARTQIEDDTLNMTEEEIQEYTRSVVTPGKTGWNHKMFEKFLEKEKETDLYKQSEPEVEEGVLQCKRCKSKRVISCQTQSRRADEPMTTVAQCSKCKVRWTENN